MASLKKFWPVAFTAIVTLSFVGLRLARSDWDPVGLAELGTQFSEGDPAGTEGYDGQFTYYMALELNPEQIGPKLDVPAYRYQRILLPFMARGLSIGNPQLAGWWLLAINLVSHLAGTWMVTGLVHRRTERRRYGLIYGLWVGLVVGVGTFLHEPLAFALVAAALWFRDRESYQVSALAFGLALFAKETTGLFWIAVLLVDLSRRQWRSVGPLLISGVAYAVFQVYLLTAFGALGLGSGGAGGSPFELIPFMGLLRVAAVDLRVFAAYLLIFVPGIVLPALWGLWRVAADLTAREFSLDTGLLGLHGVLMVFLPFSTYREPLGLVRIACGLVVAVMIYAASNGHRRVLNYSMFLPAYLVLLAS